MQKFSFFCVVCVCVYVSVCVRELIFPAASQKLETPLPVPKLLSKVYKKTVENGVKKGREGEKTKQRKIGAPQKRVTGGRREKCRKEVEDTRITKSIMKKKQRKINDWLKRRRKKEPHGVQRQSKPYLRRRRSFRPVSLLLGYPKFFKNCYVSACSEKCECTQTIDHSKAHRCRRIKNTIHGSFVGHTTGVVTHSPVSALHWRFKQRLGDGRHLGMYL